MLLDNPDINILNQNWNKFMCKLMGIIMGALLFSSYLEIYYWLFLPLFIYPIF